MNKMLWPAVFVLGGAVFALFAGGSAPRDVAAQTPLPEPLARTALLRAGGRTIGGPGSVTEHERIFDACNRAAGGAVLGCEPLDICLTIANVGSRPVDVGFFGPPGDVLVSLLEVEPRHAQTACAKDVVSVDVAPTTENGNLGRLALPVELHWRIDAMPET